jgi:hypothetical protein
MALNDYALVSSVLTFIQHSYMLFVFIDLKRLSCAVMCHVFVIKWKGYLGKVYLDM